MSIGRISRRELRCSEPRMKSLNFWNKLPFNGLVKKSAKNDKVGNFQTLGMIRYPNISDVDMTWLLSSRHSPICFHSNRNLIVLLENNFIRFVIQCLHEQFYPNCVWEIIARTHQFCISLLFVFIFCIVYFQMKWYHQCGSSGLGELHKLYQPMTGSWFSAPNA